MKNDGYYNQIKKKKEREMTYKIKWKRGNNFFKLKNIFLNEIHVQIQAYHEMIIMIESLKIEYCVCTDNKNHMWIYTHCFCIKII